MLRSDADSGRSSCSAGSAAEGAAAACAPLRPLAPPSRRPTREASTNTDTPAPPQTQRPRTLGTQHSFPQRQLLTASVFDLHIPSTSDATVPRKGGLTNAFSTIDLISSTNNETNHFESKISRERNAQSKSIDFSRTELAQKISDELIPDENRKFPERTLPGRFEANPLRKEQNVRRAVTSRLKVRRQPVQRAASRLYRAESLPGKGGDVCVGPEFIVRATHPSRQLDISTATDSSEKRTVVVILLNGQKIDVACEPQNSTAGQVFQAVVRLEQLEHNFMLGLSALIGGDFVFLPDDYRIRKVAPEIWCSNSAKKKNPKRLPIPDETTRFTLFLRIKFFMPPNLSKAVRGGAWRGWVYLQLRRSVVEGQITLQLPQLVELAGYALQAEFGKYSFREHCSGDYFLMEHYFPEGSFSEDESNIRHLLKQAHESHKNMTSEEAKEKFISLVQIFKDYGSHFYTAVWPRECSMSWMNILSSPK